MLTGGEYGSLMYVHTLASLHVMIPHTVLLQCELSTLALKPNSEF